LGHTVEVLVEGPSKTALKHDDGGPQVQLTGRTHDDRIVVFEGNRRQIGQLLNVTIFDTNPFTLFGEVVTEHVGPEVYNLI
jgi:tRNA-2-methylthio-N6-dimethylallyladenosine synthase